MAGWRAGRRGGWLAGWVAGRLAGRLAGRWLAGRPAGWLAGWSGRLAGWLTGCLAGCLAGGRGGPGSVRAGVSHMVGVRGGGKGGCGKGGGSTGWVLRVGPPGGRVGDSRVPLAGTFGSYDTKRPNTPMIPAALGRRISGFARARARACMCAVWGRFWCGSDGRSAEIDIEISGIL